MRRNKIRELLKAGKPTFATHIHSVWPSIVEAVGLAGVYDYVEFVAEYAPYNLHDLDNMCRAAEVHDLGTMIKVDQDCWPRKARLNSTMANCTGTWVTIAMTGITAALNPRAALRAKVRERPRRRR